MPKRRVKTIEEKLQIIEDLKKGETFKALSVKYDCDPITIRRIKAQESEICQSRHVYRKRLRRGQYKEIEEPLFEWFKGEKKKGTIIASRILLAKAKDICHELGINFKPHITWLKRWKIRHGIDCEKNPKKTIKGVLQENRAKNRIPAKVDDLDVNDEESKENYLKSPEYDHIRKNVHAEQEDLEHLEDENFEEEHLEEGELEETHLEDDPSEEDHLEEEFLEENDNISGTDLMKQYTTDNILNAAATGFLYKALPESKDSKKSTQQEQDRLSILFICNAAGSYKKIYVVGNSEVRYVDLPLPYFINKEACMTEGLWNKILTSLDIEFGEMNRKVLMFIDMPICRNFIIKLKNINLKLTLPTTIVAPLDQGIINEFKREYRQIIVRKQLIALQLGKNSSVFSQSITILKALGYIKQAWNAIKKETIFKGFDLAGFIQYKSPIGNESNVLYDSIPNWQDFLHCDDYVACYGGNTEFTCPTGSTIATQSCSVSPNQHALKEVFNALQILDKYSGMHGLDKIQENLPAIEEELLKFTKKTNSRNQIP